jgi:hypothetical protein
MIKNEPVDEVSTDTDYVLHGASVKCEIEDPIAV